MRLITGSELSVQLADKIKKFYFHDKQPSWETFDELILVCMND